MCVCVCVCVCLFVFVFVRVCVCVWRGVSLYVEHTGGYQSKSKKSFQIVTGSSPLVSGANVNPISHLSDKCLI